MVSSEVVESKLTTLVSTRIASNCFFFYNNFIAALDSNRGYMNSSELIQACNQAKLHNYKIELYCSSECLKKDKDELLTESPGNMFHSDIA